ncbi:MAG TPA: outer membrane beta-barrel protein [Methylomirabilota bacterium]|nr:outer membrane beta-barrel protein [Methylomirabilota bacterium]
MKRLIVSAGVLAAGSTALQAQAPGLLGPGEGRKPWTIGASMRVFYDDNILLAPKGGYGSGTNVVGKPQDSAGFEFAPRLRIFRAVDNDFLQAAYDLSLRYYFDREGEKTDSTHQFSTLWDHRFSERYHLKMEDSLVYSDQPQVLAQGGAVVARSKSTAWNNRYAADLEAHVSETAGVRANYGNRWTDYKEEGDFSYSAILDRVEQDLGASALWYRSEISILSVGYTFLPVTFTSENLIRTDGTNNLYGTDRSYESHRLAAGLHQKLRERMDLEAYVGANITTYVESDSTINPYVNISLSYEYQPDCRIILGLDHDVTPTDVLGSAANVTQNQFTTVGSLTISHKLSPKLTGNLTTYLQHGVFNGGSSDGDVDNFYVWNLTFNYRFHENLSAELGYAWNRLESDVPDRSYSQNRIYVGVRASY